MTIWYHLGPYPPYNKVAYFRTVNGTVVPAQSLYDRDMTTEQCHRLYCSSYLFFSFSRQPRRGAFQGFNEGLQQECASHRKERWYHSGRHQVDAHQPHLSGKWNIVRWVNFNMKRTTDSCHCCFKISVLQNEKEEALTTSVWIELVVKRHRMDFCFQILCISS